MMAIIESLLSVSPDHATMPVALTVHTADGRHYPQLSHASSPFQNVDVISERADTSVSTRRMNLAVIA